MNMSVHFSSERHDWRTPPEVWNVIYDALLTDEVFDPCPPDPQFDGLSIRWGEPWYANPPYGRTEGPKWYAAAREAGRYKEGILLCPARTDTKWWHETWRLCCAVAFWKGRIKFVGAENGAPFPTCLFYFGPDPERFARVIARDNLGCVWIPHGF